MALSRGWPRAVAEPGRGGGWLGALATAVLAITGAYLALALWRADLGVPLRYTQMDDTKFYFGVVKDILDHGWYQHNPDLGAPFGLALYDFPQGADNLNFVLIKALGVFSHGYGLVTNLFFLLTFPLTALAAYYAGRRLGLRPGVACVCGVLFSLLPYHFYRHESQILLSAYYAVPLGAYLFLALFGADPLLARRPAGPRALAWASRRTLATIAACLVIGSAGLYYAAFSVLLLLAGTLVALLARRGRAAVLGGAACAALIGLTLVVNLSPSLLYAARHGANAQIARTPIESEQLGLRISTLVLPVRGHRLPLLSKVSARYAADTSPGYCESCNETLGTVGTVGFVLLGLVALVAVAGAAGRGAGDWTRRYRPAALGTVLAVALGTTGGISALIAFLVTADLRAWNRISLFIAFFSLLAVGLLLERARARLRAGVAAGLLLVVLVLGGLDETSNFFLVNYTVAGHAYHSDMAFGRAVEALLPRGSSILELPYVPFPEGYHIPGAAPPSFFATSYELLRPYLSTDGLRWSFGAIKGRPTDWEGALAAKRLDIVAGAAAAAGFQAIYVDPRGYDAATGHRVVVGLTRLLGSAPVVSERHDAFLFDLRPYVRRLRRRLTPAVLAQAATATLHPLETSCGPTPSELVLTNPGRTPRPASLSASVLPRLGGRIGLTITFPDGAVERRTAGPAPLTVRRRVVVAPGTSVVTFATAAAPASQAPLVVSAPTLTDEVLGALRSSAYGPSLPAVGLVGQTCAELYAASPAASLNSGSQRPTDVTVRVLN
ncbi:MAG TPA: hypothetical protein VFR49_08535 [Solirubrobacteraceae bacterium]|nr:hypothetical protein [Solirubrobacteraceae bacterium]